MNRKIVLNQAAGLAMPVAFLSSSYPAEPKFCHPLGFPIHVYITLPEESEMKDEHKTKGQLIAELQELRKKAEAVSDQREREEINNAILNQATEGVVLVDSDTLRFVEFNDAACNGLGYSREEFAQLTLFDIQGSLTREESIERLRGILQAGHGRFENRQRRKDGRLRDVLISNRVIYIRDRKYLVGLWLDITGRKQIEETLRSSEQRLRTILHTSNEGFWLIDKDTVTLDINPRMCAILGRNREEILGRRIIDFVDFIDLDNRAVFERQIGLRKQGQSSSFEIALCRPDGSRVLCQFNSSPLLDGAGNGIGSFAMVSDISDRKRAEDRLRESEERLRLALKAADQGLYDLNVQTGEGQVSPEYAAMLGYDPEEFEETRAAWLERLHPEDRKRAVAGYMDYIAGKIPAYHVEFRHRTKSGAWRWVLSLGKIVEWDALGKPLRMLGTYTDITDRKRAEAALRERELQLRQIIDLVPHMIFVKDWDGNYLLVNQAVAEAYKTSVESLTVKSQSDVHADVEELRRMLQDDREVMEKGQTKFIPEEPYTDAEGRLRYLQTTKVPFRTFGGKTQAVLGVAVDITERRRAEEEKDKLQAQLNQAQKMESVGRLAGGVAHDFNNMLGVIMGRAEMALCRDVSPEVRHDLEEVLKAGQCSADLTRQLLAFARKQTAAPKVLDLNETVSGMLKMLRRLIGENIDLFWIPGLDLWRVKIDPSQVDQILANLAVNARDAISGPGAITISTENLGADVSCRPPSLECVAGDYVLMTVSDTGVGMSKEVCEKIFEPFFTTKELGKGTGLGLSTIYGVVKQNGGYIYAVSRPEKGTTFRIYLPRFADDGGQPPMEEEALESPVGAETILLVEDDEALLKLYKIMLENLGYAVLVSQTPMHAVRLAQDHQGELHLLITDVVMPSINGRQLLERLRAVRPELKCLFMSGYTDDVIANQGVLKEGVNFIQKPFTSNDLAVKVRKVFNRLSP